MADLAAQCSQWQAESALCGTSGHCYVAHRWDPDGPGPATERLIVGGEVAGQLLAHNIAAFDPSTATWEPLGSDVGGTVWSLSVLGNGDLIVGGGFPFAGGQLVNSLARWNGSTWHGCGGGLTHTSSGLVVNVTDVLELPSGDIVVGGNFNLAGGLPAAGLARWDGSSWHAMGSAIANTGTGGLALANTGDVLAGIGNTVRRWSGGNWSVLWRLVCQRAQRRGGNR